MDTETAVLAPLGTRIGETLTMHANGRFLQLEYGKQLFPEGNGLRWSVGNGVQSDQAEVGRPAGIQPSSSCHANVLSFNMLRSGDSSSTTSKLIACFSIDTPRVAISLLCLLAFHVDLFMYPS